MSQGSLGSLSQAVWTAMAWVKMTTCHVDILVHKLLVTALVSVVPKHKVVNNNKSILKPTAALKLISIILI